MLPTPQPLYQTQLLEVYFHKMSLIQYIEWNNRCTSSRTNIPMQPKSLYLHLTSFQKRPTKHVFLSSTLTPNTGEMQPTTIYTSIAKQLSWAGSDGKYSLSSSVIQPDHTHWPENGRRITQNMWEMLYHKDTCLNLLLISAQLLPIRSLRFPNILIFSTFYNNNNC